MSLEEKPKLVVHIGAGKTGSSSIQFTLRENRDELIASGTKYLGLMLEHARGTQHYDWQSPATAENLAGRSLEAATNEIYGVLRAELDQLAVENILTAIWSNEWMFTRENRIIPALRKLEDDGHEVLVICYIRRHDRWAQSAYAQWGIKHKQYVGPVKAFSEWKIGRSFRFFPALKPWLHAFPGSVRLFNFDAIDDVAVHFCDFLNLEPNRITRDNSTPKAEVMAAWAVYNSRFDGEVLPEKFMNAVRHAGLFREGAIDLPDLTDLYPAQSDLMEVWKESADDRNVLNQILSEQGQPLIKDDPIHSSSSGVDPWRMNQLLLRQMFSLNERLSHVSSRLERLERRINE